MRICVLGKYPPIEGGVSANTYWIVRGLAERGHQLHVVTNADEVEETYRLTLDPGDHAWYQPEFDRTGGRVRVYNVEPFSPRSMGHIPAANPFVSRLASVAADVVRRHACDAILAYYYEPYAVAGWLASRWTDRPLIVKHAGSDLDRLFRVPDLATTYKEILRSADVVVTQRMLIPRFLGMGVDRCQLEADVPYSLPVDIFSPDAAPLDLAGAALRSDPAGDAAQASAGAGAAPVIGTYGKIGVAKGTFDLIAALGELAREGLGFTLAAMIGRAQSQSIEPIVERAGLRDRTLALPMLPNWKVPSFLRSCTAVCFLERDFPVAIHGPIVPREILASGTCLVLSREIADKQRYRSRLAPAENVLIVEDPRDHAELAATLRWVVTNPTQAQAIGQRGLQISRSIEDHEAFVDGWEDLLARHVGGAPSRHAFAVRPESRQTLSIGFDALLPDLVSFLRRRCAGAVDEFAPPPDRNPFEIAVQFCDFAAARLDGEPFGTERAKVLAAIKYAKERLLAGYWAPDDHTPVYAVSDCLHGAPVTRDAVSDLIPVRGHSVRIVPFEYDVSALGILSSVGGYEPTGDDGAELGGIEQDPVVVLFHRSANLIPCELRIDAATQQLVERCDGTRTTAQVTEDMCGYFGADTPPVREEVADRVCGALAYLYRRGVIVFGSHRDGWGWTGGSRD